jgi:hypothetical protein
MQADTSQVEEEIQRGLANESTTELYTAANISFNLHPPLTVIDDIQGQRCGELIRDLLFRGGGNNNLEELDLSFINNPIDPEAALGFGQGLTGNTTRLQRLNIHGCHIGEMNSNSSLTEDLHLVHDSPIVEGSARTARSSSDEKKVQATGGKRKR